MKKEFGNRFYFSFWSSKLLFSCGIIYFLLTYMRTILSNEVFFCSIIGIKLEFIIITYHKHTMHYMYLHSMHIACIHMKDRKEILLKSVPMLCNQQLLCIFLHLHLIYYVLDDHSKGPIIYSFDDRVSLFSRWHTMEHFLNYYSISTKIFWDFQLLVWTISIWNIKL